MFVLLELFKMNEGINPPTPATAGYGAIKEKIMKNLFIIILFLISMCLWAQNVPQTIDYQGRLADSDGNYLNSVVTVDFLIYNAEFDGTLLWSETQDVSCANGIFHVQLGSLVTFPTDLFDNADRWLELVVSGETLSPRTAIASVPYSIKAETAYTVKAPPQPQ